MCMRRVCLGKPTWLTWRVRAQIPRQSVSFSRIRCSFDPCAAACVEFHVVYADEWLSWVDFSGAGKELLDLNPKP